MKKLLRIFTVMFFIFSFGGLAVGASFNYTITPYDLADRETFLNGQGGVPFGYDPDKPPPTGVFEPGPVGFGNSSFWSNLDAKDRQYTAFRMSPKDIFGLTEVSIADLTSISYWTKNLNLQKIDWQIKIYTEGDANRWYGYRFEFVRPVNPDTTSWYKSSTDTLPVNKITSKWLSPNGTNIPINNTNNTLEKLITHYGNEKILFIDIIAGYQSPTYVNSLLDGVEIRLKNGDIATMDLENFSSLGNCISILINEQCADLKGKNRASCNQTVGDFCRAGFQK